MSDFPFASWIFRTITEALAALEAQQPRVDLVVDWFMKHGLPRPKVDVISSVYGDQEGSLEWHFTVFSFVGMDDDGEPVAIPSSTFHALQNPDVVLAEMSLYFGSAAPTADNRRARKPSEQITFERWLEPPGPIQPVPRPFGPNVDQRDPSCMLSNSTDQFKVGAYWDEPDGSTWRKKRVTQGFFGTSSYSCWEQVG